MNGFERAKALAKEAHDRVKQARNGRPYWEHPFRVAGLVTRWGGSKTAIMAAYLHDVLEDVAPVYPEYHQRILELSPQVYAVVVDVTNVFSKESFPELNRKARKHLEAVRLSGTSTNGRLVKLADIYDNTMGPDPSKGLAYQLEKLHVLQMLATKAPKSQRAHYMRVLSQLESLTRCVIPGNRLT